MATKNPIVIPEHASRVQVGNSTHIALWRGEYNGRRTISVMTVHNIGKDNQFIKPGTPSFGADVAAELTRLALGYLFGEGIEPDEPEDELEDEVGAEPAPIAKAEVKAPTAGVPTTSFVDELPKVAVTTATEAPRRGAKRRGTPRER